ncbi:MAG: metallophosphoesterase [Verrucomicrobiota bacterium]|nr:metallophosphoesterase [Verrucomicrobiota bacterium]
MQTILHLTDIHFGWEGESPSGLAERKVCLDSLLNELSKLEPQWKPTIICLTGDIGWKGIASDYTAAKLWIDSLLSICGLSYDSLIVCAGNHDVVRSMAIKLSRPPSAAEADQVLEAPVAAHYEGPFSPFVSFCRTAGIPPLNFGDSISYLVGERTVNGIHFLALNSAWFCKDDDDKGKLWIGYPHMKFMEADKQMILHPSPDDRITVALIHHPQEWLHEDEIHARSSRPNVVDYLANRCHLILTGHTHGEVRGADRIADQALHFTGGSAYAGASHFNSFRLLQVTPEAVVDRAFEFNPRSADEKWKSKEARFRPLTQNHCQASTIRVAVTSLNNADLRDSCRKEAERLLELKSRLLKQKGPLPVLVQRPVSLRVSAQRDRFDSTGNLIRLKDAEQLVPLYEAVRQARRTLLLGDLGSGKSTLAAQLVINTLERSTTAVAILIPVKVLRLTGHFTRRDLLVSVSNYVKDVVWLSSTHFTLEDLLNQQVELLLVFDGLDELPRDVAGRLLSEAAAIVENWPTIQVVATARPVELVGTSFSDWRVIHAVSLDDAAKSEFLRQELTADGEPAEQVDEKTAVLLRSLKESTALDSVANSPLAIRLIYPRLKDFTANGNLTLGDLLYDVLMDRLGGWEKRDDKPSAFAHLNQFLPTVVAKAEYLAVLAEHAATGKRLGREEAKSLFHDAGSAINGANPHLLAEEALGYFEWLGLVSGSDTIDFPLQPLAEVCAATNLVAKWHSNPREASLRDRTRWRIASFAVAIARRRGLMVELRDAFASTIAYLLGDLDLVPAACYLVVESASPELAKTTVSLIDKAGYRPLRYFQDEQKVSVRNIAKTLVLAGDKGFDWFFTDYLDPRYPVPNAGCLVVSEVFAEWAALVRPQLTYKQIEKLGSMVEPYQATGEGCFYGVLPILSIIAPDAFTPDKRILHQSFALDSSLFADLVESKFRSARNDGILGPVVEQVLAERSSESISVARLWLEFNPTRELPHSIIRLAIRSVTRPEHSTSAIAIIKQCQERLGEEKWVHFARWFLVTGDKDVSVGAAKVLFDRGERRLSLLGKVAMAGMHDGGYLPDAEKILGELIRHSGECGSRWLADRIACSGERTGGHSGWWRLLLPLIDSLDNGPQLLANCIRTLGPYTIPRHPEIREAFARVLKGPRGTEFCDSLRKQLKNLDPNTRRGAALILISSDPSGEADALFVMVRSRACPLSFDWHECEEFILTLEFGPSVLSSLKGKLGLLEPQSKSLALVLLHKGRVDLDSKQREELLAILSTLGNWHLNRDPASLTLLCSDNSCERLKEHLKNSGSELAERAAERLLEFHSKNLTSIEEAKCLAIRHAKALWCWELAGNLKRIARDTNFARDLMAACNEIIADGGCPPLLGLAARAITENSGWKDVLWALLCDGTGFGGRSESEHAGMALLEFGLEEETYRSSIAKAAKDCLADPRFNKNRWHETYHWTALLADEFGEIDKETIRGAIVHGKPIWYSATTALIARLGYVPADFSTDRAHRHMTATVALKPHRDLATIVHDLKEYSRESDELHPDLLSTVQEVLPHPAIDESTLITIAATGKPGILIATFLRLIYGQMPPLSETIPLLDIYAKAWCNEDSKQELSHLIKAWKMLRASAILEDKSAADKYLAALDRELSQGSVWKLAIAWEILQIRGALLNEQISVFFTEYAKHASFLHDALYDHLCIWLGKEATIEIRQALVTATEHAIIMLNETPWHPKSGEHSNPWANLLIPAVFWANGGSNSDSAEAVFLRGIRDIFERIPNSNQQPNSSTLGLLSRLEPILKRVSPDILHSTLSRGTESLEPSVSIFCRMIEAFATKH